MSTGSTGPELEGAAPELGSAALEGGALELGCAALGDDPPAGTELPAPAVEEERLEPLAELDGVPGPLPAVEEASERAPVTAEVPVLEEREAPEPAEEPVVAANEEGAPNVLPPELETAPPSGPPVADAHSPSTQRSCSVQSEWLLHSVTHSPPRWA
ncbi:MAG: hypothetical protein HY904_15890 [Deltaproteobacteria bacterium]|nr:hypothetical protein [Deltaproteobacteria bacterium]